MTEVEFPLYTRVDAIGVLDGGSALIVAPTGTGKSYIGREAIVRALRRGEPGTHAYLVPFRALAAEVYEAFQELLAGTDARVRISTGDHRDLLRPDEADLVVATYESFAGLLQRASFRPGVAPRSSRCCSVQVVRQGEPQPLLWYRVMEGQAEWILLR